MPAGRADWESLWKDELVHVLSEVISKKTEEQVLEDIKKACRVQKNTPLKCVKCQLIALKLFGKKESKDD